MAKEAIYGYPCVSDPHDFTPDVECSSPEEIATWERACVTYGTADYQPNKGCSTELDGAGGFKHLVRTSWGIGINYVDMSELYEEAEGEAI
jgi:hypothetical protein